MSICIVVFQLFFSSLLNSHRSCIITSVNALGNFCYLAIIPKLSFTQYANSFQGYMHWCGLASLFTWYLPQESIGVSVDTAWERIQADTQDGALCSCTYMILLSGRTSWTSCMVVQSVRTKSGVAVKETTSPTQVSGQGGFPAEQVAGQALGFTLTQVVPVSSSIVRVWPPSLPLASLSIIARQEMKEREKGHCSKEKRVTVSGHQIPGIQQ